MPTGRTLSGRVALVTGGASGIGRAIALGFAAEGADVLAVDVSVEGLSTLASSGILPFAADVTRDAEVRAAVSLAVERFGRLDILFNNAGVGGVARIEEAPDGEFERFAAVHLFGAFYGLRAGLQVMRKQGYGRVVNMLSRGAESQRPGWAAYAAAKAGLFALTRVAAAECSGVDILINGMIPGQTETGMTRMTPGATLQPPEAVVPSALWLATLPAGGPSGKVFWRGEEYSLFAGAD